MIRNDSPRPRPFPKQPFFSFRRRKRLTVPSSSVARVSAWSYTAAPAPLHAHPPTQPPKARYIQRLTGDAQTRIEILRLVLRLDLIRDDHDNDNSGRDDLHTHQYWPCSSALDPATGTWRSRSHMARSQLLACTCGDDRHPKSKSGSIASRARVRIKSCEPEAEGIPVSLHALA